MMFEYASDNKRYHTLNYHLKTLFSDRVFKASIDAGFSCPNESTGGCTYCKGGSGEFTTKGSITEQLERERARIKNKWGDKKLIAYFQANTNTFARVDVLREKYFEALNHPSVVGISIATRADCLPPDVLNLLEEISKKTYLTVELGLQTVHDKTAEKINRGYNFEVFEKSFYQLKNRGIRTVVHIINGLVGETRADMLATAEVLAKMEPDGVKIHLLHVLKDTVCEKEYAAGDLKTLEKDEYIDITVEQIRRFKKECVIERVTGDGKRESLVAPLWSLDKISVLGGIDKCFADKNAFQGDLYEN
ncbi:MAG: TIGR01212 family radical SAM protein [Clostridia bacterium]|nr:TIGR01212 family radical SAM protein [Clostridia bacterium]